MQKIYYNILIGATALAAVSCESKDSPVEPVIPPTPTGVEVKIAATAIETKAAVTEFKANDKMNIFAKTYNRIDAPNIIDDVVATLNGNTWDMEPKVYIDDNQKNAFVYAVAPFDATYIDAQKIPVDLNRQVDLMYSGSYQPASLNTPTVKLSMKHALSLLSFNIIPVNYSGAGNLTSITISGEAFYVNGTMDTSTGKITLTSTGSVEAKFNKQVTDGGWKSDIPGVWTLPFNTKATEVKFAAVIDGKTYETIIPEVEVKTGWQYIFRLALTNNGLEFDPSKTETLSLNIYTEQAQEFAGFGIVTVVASGTWLNSPIINGDAIFGTLITPSGASPYDGTKKVESLTAGDKVAVESWNSSGFTLETLDGVQTIDITEYE